MKSFLILCACLCMLHCAAQKTTLKLTRAEQQSWSGGAAGSGNGTNYTVTFTVAKAGAYRFAYLYINYSVLNVTCQQPKATTDSVITLKAGQSITLMAQRYNPGEIDKRIQRDTVNNNMLHRNAAIAGIIPAMYKDNSVLIYYYKGRKKYLHVTPVITLVAKDYP